MAEKNTSLSPKKSISSLFSYLYIFNNGRHFLFQEFLLSGSSLMHLVTFPLFKSQVIKNKQQASFTHYYSRSQQRQKIRKRHPDVRWLVVSHARLQGQEERLWADDIILELERRTESCVLFSLWGTKGRKPGPAGAGSSAPDLTWVSRVSISSVWLFP